MKTNGAATQESDAGEPAASTALARTQDRDVVRQRRELIMRLFIDERLTLERIVDRLARRKPPIIVSRWTVSRDLAQMRRENRRLFNPRRFDAINFVLEKVASYESLARKCIRDAHHTKDTRARVLAYRAAAEINERITNLMADSGFIDRRIGTLVIDDETPATRIPNGVELQERYANTIVTTEDLTSSAERSFLYGDWQQAEAAALEATAGTNGNGNGNGHR